MRVSVIVSVLLLVLVVALPLPAPSQPPVETTAQATEDARDVAEDARPAAPVDAGASALTPDDLEAWLDGFFPYALAAGDIAGGVVVVVKDGQVLLQKGYGYSDLETRAPVLPEATLFRPGSVSKLFTWTAVMQLVEQGKLDLDADLNQYIDFSIAPTNGKPITLRQVMTHTTGMEEQIRSLITSDPKQITPLGDALKRWTPARIHAPGSTPAYSNYATALAGYVVERVSGESFDDYVDRHIFVPLQMRHSSFRQPLPAALLEGMSKGYASASDGKPRPYEFISLAPAGSLAATGADMANFMVAHLQGGEFAGQRILQPATVHAMHSTGQASVGPLNQMMLGFYETTVNGHRAIAHGGDTRWFHSDLQLFPDDGIGIFVSLNSSGQNRATGHIRTALVREFADRYLPGSPHQFAGVSEQDARLHARQIAGSYQSSRRPQTNPLALSRMLGPLKVLANEDGTISVTLAVEPGGKMKKWREVEPYVWQDLTGSDRLAADVVDGRVTRFSLEPYAPIMVFERLSWGQANAATLMYASVLVLLLTVLAWPVSALVRRYYGIRHTPAVEDARAHRMLRLSALVVLLVFAAILGLVVSMLSNLEMAGPKSDGWLVAFRWLAMLLLPLGTLASLWSAWRTLRGSRRVLARLWAVLVALACLCLLWIACAHGVFGLGANY